MNIKARLRNKTFIAAIISAVIACVYQILGVCGVVAPISQDGVIQAVGIILNILVGIGVLVDPTTKGISDKSEK
jgi:phi LC3 family holin